MNMGFISWPATSEDRPLRLVDGTGALQYVAGLGVQSEHQEAEQYNECGFHNA